MKTQRLTLLLAFALIAAGPVLAQLPTDGWSTYPDTFKVQKPYNLPVEQRFSDTGGMYTCWIQPNDKPFEVGTPTGPRTEMRWSTWADQKIEHMFDADVMYEPGTNHTCIMQIKSNTSGEAVYMQVADNGDLRNSSDTPFLTNYAGKWFNLKTAYNPATGTGRAWIDNVLKVTTHHSNSADWYFKNGTYCNGMAAGTVSKSHYKNIKFWIHVASTLEPHRESDFPPDAAAAFRLEATASRPQILFGKIDGHGQGAAACRIDGRELPRFYLPQDVLVKLRLSR